MSKIATMTDACYLIKSIYRILVMKRVIFEQKRSIRQSENFNFAITKNKFRLKKVIFVLKPRILAPKIVFGEKNGCFLMEKFSEVSLIESFEPKIINFD